MSDDGGSNRRAESGRGSKRAKRYTEAILPDDEVIRRVDLREAPRPGLTPAEAAAAEAAAAEALGYGDWIGGPAPDAPFIDSQADAPLQASRVERVRPDRLDADDRRRLLWRDSAMILIVVVLVLLAGQVFLPQQAAGPVGSPTPLPSQIAIGSLAPPVSLPPGATFGPIVNPSLGVDATPTPIPVITLGPTPTPSPSPTPVPTDTLRPSTKPSVKPSTKPTATPKPTKTPTPVPTPPPPDANFSTDITDLVVQFNNSSSGDTAWSWDFGDGIGTSTLRNPTYAYTDPGTYSVTLTVSGPGGPDSSISHNVTVPPSP